MKSLQSHIARIEKQIIGLILLKSALIGLSFFGLMMVFVSSMTWAIFLGMFIALGAFYFLGGFKNHR
ncbi:MAG: hypothetical protein ACI942_003003, partial [Planctomycetota bacterium]